MKRIKWNYSGPKIRTIHGYTFNPGQIIEVDDEEVALDILTQPNEEFEEVRAAKKSARKKGA